MTRQSSHPDSRSSKPVSRQASRTIPDKPRDCGPHVDTWPILDEQETATPKGKEPHNRK